MKMLIEKKILMEGVNCVSKALSTKNIIPILNGIKFDLSNNGLYLTATDNDITIQQFIDKKDIVNIEEEGCTIVYGKTLLNTISKLPESNILVENIENNEVSFKTENGGVYKFPCFNKEDYPSINLEYSKTPITINADKLKEAINNTSFACSLQESRPTLTGVNIKIIGNMFEAVATDSYRLSKMNITLDSIYNENINIIIPARGINELAKILDKDNNIEINIFPNRALFKLNNILFQTSLINGNYPNTDNSIPKEFKYKIKANIKELFNLVDIVSSLSQYKDKCVVDLEIKENELIISSSSEEGKGKDKIFVKNEYNNNIRISFSVKYMLEALKILKGDELYLLLNGEISPIILKEINNDELTQLILPLKTY